MSKGEAPTAADVRAWAREKGLDIGSRGRIPASVREAFNARRKPDNQYTGWVPGTDLDDPVQTARSFRLPGSGPFRARRKVSP